MFVLLYFLKEKVKQSNYNKVDDKDCKEFNCFSIGEFVKSKIKCHADKIYQQYNREPG